MKLSHRYIPARQLPDKSVSLLDTACARVAIGQNAIAGRGRLPPRRSTTWRSRSASSSARVPPAPPTKSGSTSFRPRSSRPGRAAELEAGGTTRRAGRGDPHPLAEARAAHQEERAAITRRRPAVSADGRAGRDAGGARDSRRASCETPGRSSALASLVDGQTIAEVVSGWTGIPVGKMLADEIQTVLNLKQRLEERVIGQSHALEAIAQRIRTARANLTDPRRPIGVFLLVGPSGVGKTETAMALADTLYGGERNMVMINMSEYQEAHKVSGLRAPPPATSDTGRGAS